MSFLTSWLTQERQKRVKRYWPILLGSISLLFIVSVPILFLCFPGFSNNKQFKISTQQLQLNQRQALAQLDRIENRLTQLSNHADKASISSEETQLLNQQLTTIQHGIENLHGEKNDTIQQAIVKENKQLYQKLDKIQNLLDQFKIKNYSHSLNHSSIAMPFRIISIDIWNGQPMATIQLGREPALMAEGDSRAGWTLVQINFEASEVVFKNRNQQYRRIKV